MEDEPGWAQAAILDIMLIQLQHLLQKIFILISYLPNLSKSLYSDGLGH